MVVVPCGMCAHTINSLQEERRTSIRAFSSRYRARGSLREEWAPGRAVTGVRVKLLQRGAVCPREPLRWTDIPPFTRWAVENRCVLMGLFFSEAVPPGSILQLLTRQLLRAAKSEHTRQPQRSQESRDAVFTPYLDIGAA